MDLRCPHCNSSDLKKVSIAYKEGLSRGTARTGFRALLFGEDGPNVIVGRAVTNGTYQTELSKSLRPPRKRSYGKLLLGAGLVSLTSLIFYIHVVMANASKSSAMPVVLFGAIGTSVFFVLLFVAWRHNHLVYPRQYDQWNRSVVCQGCGALSQHKV
jgi:hypothetical protein